MITRENYEAYFLDYSEGNLKSSELAELFAFLADNPDLNEELLQFDCIQLKPEDCTYQHKTSLKHKEIEGTVLIHEHNFNDYFIAYHEGDLDASGKAEVELFLKKNSFLERDFKAFAAARLQPEKISYPQKASLKKGGKSVVFYRTAAWVSVAATVAAIYFISLPRQIQPVPELKTLTVIDTNSSLKVTAPIPSENKIAGYKPLPAAPDAEKSITLPVRNTEVIAFMPALQAKQLNIEVRNSGIISQKAAGNELFDDIMLRYDIAEADNQHKPGFIARSIQVIGNLLHKKENFTESSEKNPITLWDIANYGVKGLNEITSSNIELKHSRNEEGKIDAFSFGNDNFRVARCAPEQ